MITYSSATKSARMTAVVTAIGASGKLKLFTAGDVLLATFTLAATAGTVSGSVLTLSDANGATAGILNATAVAAGTATKASVTTSGDVDVITGLTVGLSASDLVMDNNAINTSQVVTVNSATFTHA